MPKISIITAAFNSGPLIIETINSVLKQTLTDFEFIIVDDGSTDNTPNILTEFEEKDERIKVHLRNHIGNPGVHRLFALERACGQFICFLDHDDLWKNSKLEQQVKFLESHPQFAVVFTGVHRIDNEGEFLRVVVPDNSTPIWNWIFNQEKQSEDSTFFNFDPRLYLFGVPTANCSSMLRREIYESLGGLNESSEILGVEDYELWLRLGYNNNIAIMNEPLLLSRWTGKNLSATSLPRYANAILSANRSYPSLVKSMVQPWGAYGKRRWFYLLMKRIKGKEESNIHFIGTRILYRGLFYFYALISRLDGSYKLLRGDNRS